MLLLLLPLALLCSFEARVLALRRNVFGHLRRAECDRVLIILDVRSQLILPLFIEILITGEYSRLGHLVAPCPIAIDELKINTNKSWSATVRCKAG